MAVVDEELGKLASLWLETAKRPSWPELKRDLRVDVAVLGAGITGLTAAMLLARDGVSVAVLEARFVGAGATGYTTAKLSSLHGLTYASLASRHGDDVAWLYGEMNESGVASIAGLVEDLGIDCDLRVKPNYTYAESEKDVRKVRDEAEVTERLGLPSSFVEELDLPFPVAGAVRFDNQAEFHPGKYLAGLADAVTVAGGALFERTRAVDVDDGSPCTVTTATGKTVTAGHVVVATHIPFLDRGFYFARTHPERSYVVAAPLDTAGSVGPKFMYLSTEQPAHSIRVHELADGRRFLLVGGESHKTGQADALTRYQRLADYARERFGVQRIAYHWSTQDNMPIDGVPYVGKLHPLSRGVLVATGYKKWGLAMGTAAGELLADLVVGRDNPYVRLVDPSRMRVRASVPTYLKENANVGYHFFADRLLRRGPGEDLEPGEGKVVGSGVGQRAISRDEAGNVHTLSARCSHLGCIVAWNSAERTWDCPCHGSRFRADGEVIQGPAVSPLAREE